jgi:hypothetical protein
MSGPLLLGVACKLAHLQSAVSPATIALMSASIWASRSRGVLVTALAMIAMPGPVRAETDTWQFALTPYLWLPSVEGTGEFETPPDGGGQPEVEVGPVDYLEHLELALMLAGEARKGKWTFRADVVYVDFGDQRSSVKTVTGPGGVVEIPVNTGTTVSLDGLEWQGSVGYVFLSNPAISMEILGGFRYLDVSASLDWQFDGPLNLLPQSGTASQDVELWDAIVGTRGRAVFGNGKWFVPFSIDVGAGSSDLTWQSFAGLGYAFSWGDVLAAYRHLEYDQKQGDLLQGVRFSGPAIGVSFRF